MAQCGDRKMLFGERAKGGGRSGDGITAVRACVRQLRTPDCPPHKFKSGQPPEPWLTLHGKPLQANLLSRVARHIHGSVQSTISIGYSASSGRDDLPRGRSQISRHVGRANLCVARSTKTVPCSAVNMSCSGVSFPRHQAWERKNLQ